jgi:PAS domain S-box-containing protein
MFGYESAEAMAGKPITSLYAPEITDQVLEYYQSWKRGAVPEIQAERIAIKRDGARFDVFVNVKKVTLQDGPAEIAFYTDITERKKNELELEKYREHLELLVQERTAVQQLLAAEREILFTALMSIAEGVIAVDKEGFINLFNPAAEKITGFPSDEAIEQPIQSVFQLCDSNTQEPIQDILSSLLEMDRMQQEAGNYRAPTLITRTGSRVLVSGSISALRSTKDEVSGYVIVFQDITEKYRVESQTVLSQKMEAIGQLAAGIAHEINTPIQYIGDNLKFLNKAFSKYTEMLDVYNQVLEDHRERQVAADDFSQIDAIRRQKKIAHYGNEIPAAIQEALDGTERVRKIVLAMREFSHPSEKEKKLADINHGIETTIAISRNEWKYCAEMQTDLDPELPPVNCQIDEINQVILNMIVNAAQAIQEKIQVGSGQKEVISISTRLEQNQALIIVRDTGPGIPEPIRERIFDPFFTTKGIGKGTGQGLSLAHNIIVKKHQGKISVESEVGRGTAFTIALPLSGIETEQ